MVRGIVARKEWLWWVLSLVLCLALASSAVAPALAEDAEGGCDDCFSYSIMRPDRETLERWIEAYNNAPRAYIEMEGFQVPSLRGSLSLLDHLEYTPAERNQGTCGNCWAWAGTGCLGIALHVQEGIKDRLSVQYINSCKSGDYACCGGSLEDLVNFYDPPGGTGLCIPWSNTNASWQDISKRCTDGSSDVDCGSISTDPNYPITAIQEQVIPTLPPDGVTDQATAIANIKYVLDQNKAVWFGFLLPNDTAWDSFGAFWASGSESDVYAMDQFCSTPYDPSPGEGGGHAVLCVGYNDDDPENSYWYMLNSWGTAAGRPNGLFRIDMDMNYQGTNDPYYSFYWQTLDVTFDIADQPDITVDPTSFDVTLPPDTTQDYTLTIGNDGNADLTYSISDRETTGESAPAAVQLPPSQLAARSIPPDKANADELPLFEAPSAAPSPTQEYVPDQLIVKFNNRVTSAAVDQLNQSLGTEVIYTSRYAGFKVLQAPQGKTVAETVEAYSEQPIVEYAEPNYIYHATWSPDDPFYSYQWHFDHINVEAAWDLDTTPPNYGGDPSIVVAVIDSGVAYETYGGYIQAPDLAGTTFTSGYDFVNDDAHPNDDNCHGTHVCGTIAQSTNNGLGVAGIAFNSAIMPVKVLNSAGSGTVAQIADGVYYAADNGAHIINMSLGGELPSTTMENAVAYAYNHSVTIVSAAGNSYEEGNNPEYPAAYDDYCIAVGATRYDQTRAPYSNTGSYLDIAAPGGDTDVDQNSDGYLDGVLQQTFNIYTQDPTDFGYWFLEGTSMACPHVAGVAALILAKNPSFTPDQVRQALESTATDLGTPGRDDEYGWGLLNAPAAISWAVSNNPPNTPANPSPADQATGVSIDAGLNWTGGDPDAGDTVTYDVYLDTTGATTLVSNDQSAITYDPGTLSHNTTYYWKIVATDNYMASTTSPVWDFTTATEDCPWLGVNSTSGSVAPSDSHNITVSINTTGLGSNYTAEIVIASNDPDEDPTVVPVTLHVSAAPPGEPDITVFPTSFNKTLTSNTTQNYTLTIGNVGDAELNYTITDRETTGEGSGSAPTGTSSPPTSPPVNSDADNARPVEEPDIRPGAQEEHTPRQIFEEGDTLEELRDKIEQNGYNFTVDHNWVYDMSPEEKENFFGRHDSGLPEGADASEDIGPLAMHFGTRQLPSQFDWRNYGGHSYIGDIRNQGTCGSCYAFGACAAAEGTYNLAMGLYDGNCSNFSESFIMWCLGNLPEYNPHFYGCDGADYTYSELAALTVEGVSSEADFPYQTWDGCGDHWDDPRITFDSWYRIPCGDIDAIKTAIMTYGVVDVAVLTTSAFQAYSGGIYEDTNTDCYEDPCYNTPTNHCVALVGWDDNGDPDTNGYWILRNSWGADDWGESGYMRIKYHSARVACAACYLVYSDGEDCPWLNVSPTCGSVTPGGSHNLTVSINTTGLGSNYTAEIVIASNDPDEDPKIVPVTLHVVPPEPTLELNEGINIITYTGATTSLPEALTNISELVDIIWARGIWTGGDWYRFFFYNGFPVGELEELEVGRAYIIVVSEHCIWELPQ